MCPLPRAWQKLTSEVDCDLICRATAMDAPGKRCLKGRETGTVCISMATKHTVDTYWQRPGLANNPEPHLANYRSLWVTELISACGSTCWLHHFGWGSGGVERKHNEFFNNICFSWHHAFYYSVPDT